MLDPCVEWQGYRNSKGYGRSTIGGVRMLAHRRAYCEAHGLHPDDIAGKVVRHKCDNPPCINADHLELGTYEDNNRDRAERGRSADMRGERSHTAVLTAEQADAIRRRYVRYSREHGCGAMAREYGVDLSTIHNIVSGRSWDVSG